MKSARQIAAQALIKVNQEGAFSNLVLDHLLEKSGLDARGKAFCTQLFYGVLERRLTLDAVLQRYCRQPLRKLAPAARELLRLAVYQILYLDSVPASAAVNESVSLCRNMGCGYASGLLNGVLRSFLRDGGDLAPTLPLREEDEAGWLSLYYSAPLWLVRLWQNDYGTAQTQELLASALGRPPLYLRVNPLRSSAQELARELEQGGVEVEIRQDIEACVAVSRCGSIERLPAYQEGRCTVQDIASQLAALAVQAQPGMRCLDVCAAPGGKSFVLAQQMHNQGEVWASDQYEFKARLIEQGAKRLGLSILHVGCGDATVYEPQRGMFDRVLCDVPCSGLGILRRKPEIRYKGPEELEDLPEIQYKILETSANYVKEGGRLVYSTCTLRRAENDGVVDRFLQQHPEFCPAPLTSGLDKLTGASGGRATLFPARLGSDGFFFCAMQRVKGGP